LDRQRIADQIGALEEQLELLQRLAARNCLTSIQKNPSFDFAESTEMQLARGALESLQAELGRQREEKSVPARKFLKRISSVLVQECAALDRNISISVSGTGTISMDMAELAMNAILHTLKAAIGSAFDLSSSERSQRHLFQTMAFSLQVKAEPENIHFVLTDDGQGHQAGGIKSFEQEKQFQKIRSHLALCGGWFRRKNLQPYGGMIEFKLPFLTGRFQGAKISSNGVEAVIPGFCISDFWKAEDLLLHPWNGPIACLDEEKGLSVCGPEARPGDVFLKLAIADFECLLKCRVLDNSLRLRKLSGADFFTPDSSFKALGIYNEGESAVVLPMIEGETLFHFYLMNWGRP
jgi:hypothetical protein